MEHLPKLKGFMISSWQKATAKIKIIREKGIFLKERLYTVSWGTSLAITLYGSRISALGQLEPNSQLEQAKCAFSYTSMRQPNHLY